MSHASKLNSTLPLIPSHQGRGKKRKSPIKVSPPLVGGGKGEGKDKNQVNSLKKSPLKNLIIFLLITAVSFAIYCNTLSNQFVFDDIPLIVENSAIRSPKNIPEIMGLKNGIPFYRPVRFLSYVMDYAVSGLNPISYHISNILYHAAAAFVLFCLLRLLTGSETAAITGALIFTVHPVNTESVAYISGRRDILCALFYLMGFHSFVLYRQRSKSMFMIFAFICFILAAGSKEMGVTLPAICLLYDLTFIPFTKALKRPFLKFIKPYWSFILITALYLYYKLILHYPSLRTEYYGGSAISNFATVFRIICRYLQLVLFPVVLHADYSYNVFPVSSSFIEPEVFLSSAIAIVLFLIIIMCFKKHRLVFFGGMWFFVTLLPVCQIFPHHEMLAEHYLYLPSVGFIIMLSPLWEHLFSFRKYALAAVIAAILLLFSVRTIVRNMDWKDSMTLWSNVLETTPDCARAQDNMGSEYFKRKEFQKALLHYSRAMNLRPEHGVFHNNLGMALGATGNVEKAEAEFEKALSLNPELAAAYNNMGIVNFNKGKYTRAAWLFLKSAQMKPSARAWFNCGNAQLKIEKPFKAAVSFYKAIKLDSAYAEAYNGLGIAQTKMANYSKAVESFQKAISLKPGFAEAYSMLASVYEKTGDREKSLWYFEKGRLIRDSGGVEKPPPASLR